MAPTPSPRTTPGHHHHHHQTPSRTPQSKQRLQFQNQKNTAANPPSAGAGAATAVPTEHPVEVIGRVRNYPDHKEKPASVLEIADDARSVRVRTDVGYRDFSLDGVSVAEDEGLEGFYRRFVGSRVEGIRLGAKCTIMMYGPTGSGKSHTMFGCAKEPGIVYRALRDILNGGNGEGVGPGSGEDDDTGFSADLFVQVAVLEIYNEEIYDLLSGNPGAAGGCGTPTTNGVPKGSTPKVRLEVMGKKAKNATYITGNEAGKISREVAKLEKRRIVKSTLCNERSSRSHCLIILEVPSVGGRLMLVDMAGSENIEAAGQTGFEAKMQTAKINQGNIALKRVVESIANGDSHVPFRDSKLTMLLQDSFEDDKSKILMILCASPDPKEMHKTISTLEYGAKAKCIVRVPNMPNAKEKLESEESSTLLRSRIVAMNQFIYKLQMENKIKEKERDEAHKELLLKDYELAQLRSKLQFIEGRGPSADEEIKLKVEQRTEMLRLELRKMEERMLQQQEELNILRRRLEEVELEKVKLDGDALSQVHGGRFMKKLEACAGDQGMEKSMDLDMGDQPNVFHVKEVTEDGPQLDNYWKPSSPNPCLFAMEEEAGADLLSLPEKVVLSTVFEEEEEEGEDRESTEDDEVDKLVVEEVIGRAKDVDTFSSFVGSENFGCTVNAKYGTDAVQKSPKDASSARKARIQNIFRLCGNHRELSQQVKTFTPPSAKKDTEEALHSEVRPLLRALDYGSDATENIPPASSPFMKLLQSTNEQNSAEELHKVSEDKENSMHGLVKSEGELIDVFVKWEASNDLSGSLIRKQKISKGSNLADLRKHIEANLEENGCKFTFLLLGNPSGAPVAREKEAATLVSKLPICNSQANGYLACLRPSKKAVLFPNHHIPLGSLENTLPVEFNVAAR